MAIQPRSQLRARGNLSYLGFVRLVKRLWEGAHPDIPLLPTSSDRPAKYPCIYYGLQLRKTFEGEPKPKIREVREDDSGDAYVITAQRFQSVVNFTAVNEVQSGGPEVVEELIEVFEDFMLEMTPVLKKLGLSDILYSRRIPDAEENRTGTGVVRRTVSYLITTEKVIAEKFDKLEAILIKARTWVDEIEEYGEGYTKPRYYTVNGEHPKFTVVEDNMIEVPETYFRLGDVVVPIEDVGRSFPESLRAIHYRISNVSMAKPYDQNARYELQRASDGTVVDLSNDLGNGGIIFYVAGSQVEVEIVDQFSGEVQQDEEPGIDD